MVRSRNFFLANKDYLKSIKADFDYVSSGSVNTIIYGDREFTYVDLTSSGGKGHHLNKVFKIDIDNFITKNDGNIPRWDNNYREQMFNLDAIEKTLGKQLVMIDINDCYWRTAYLLGYITESTYIKGKKRKDWKIGRNACIGSLIKTKTIQGFTNGKVDPDKRRVVRTPLAYQMIRSHIIGHVFRMFDSLFQQMGNTFYMFLTDCLVTTYDKKRWVEEYFTSEGYKIKSKPIEFTAIDRKNKRIDWFDFSAKRKEANVINQKQGVNRYYMYSNAQVVQSTLINTTEFFK